MIPNEQAPVERQLNEGRGTHRGGCSTSKSNPGHRQHRALGGLYVDLMADGVRGLGDTYAHEYDAAVYDALVRTAMAAAWASWTFCEWSTQVQRGRLGKQAARKGNRKDRNAPATMRLLWKAWERAKARVDGATGYTAEDRALHIAAVRDFAADAAVKLTGNQRAVLAAVAALADKHQHTRPACPLHELEARTGLTRKAVRHALAALCRADLLAVARRGEWKGEGVAGARATTYHLPALAALGAHRDPGFRTYVPLAGTKPMCPLPDAKQTQPEEAMPRPTTDPTVRALLAAVEAQNARTAALEAEIARLRGDPAPVRHLRAVPNQGGPQ